MYTKDRFLALLYNLNSQRDLISLPLIFNLVHFHEQSLTSLDIAYVKRNLLEGDISGQGSLLSP